MRGERKIKRDRGIGKTERERDGERVREKSVRE